MATDYPKANDEMRGKGQPGIMAAKGTAVDAPYTYNLAEGPTKERQEWVLLIL